MILFLYRKKWKTKVSFYFILFYFNKKEKKYSDLKKNYKSCNEEKENYLKENQNLIIENELLKHNLFNLTNYSDKIKLELDNLNLDKINSDNLIENLRNLEINYLEQIKNFNIEKDELILKNDNLKKIKIEFESKFELLNTNNNNNNKNHLNLIKDSNRNSNNNNNSLKEIEFICKFCRNKQNLTIPEFPIFDKG